MERLIQYASGAVVFRKNGTVIEFLLLRAYNYWDFPKGQLEEKEKFIETAIREIFEETNLNDVVFVSKDKEKLYTETEPYGRKNKIARYYLCFVSMKESKNVILKINPEIDKAEHDEYKWLSYENAEKLLNERMRKVLKWAQDLIKNTQQSQS